MGSFKKIKSVSDASQEEVDDGDGFFDGSGEPEQTITSHRLGYSFTGEYFEGDEASELIDEMIGLFGDDRKIGFRVTDDRDNPKRKGKELQLYQVLKRKLEGLLNLVILNLLFYMILHLNGNLIQSRQPRARRTESYWANYSRIKTNT